MKNVFFAPVRWKDPLSTSTRGTINTKSTIEDLGILIIVGVWITSTIPDFTANGDSVAVTTGNEW
jgi:hypothetical protein